MIYPRRLWYAFKYSWKLFWACMRGNACAWSTNGPAGNWGHIIEGDAVAYNQALAGTLLRHGELEAMASYRDSLELDAEEAVKELIHG